VLFASGSLARRVERAEVGLILEGARAAARRLPPDGPVIVEMNGGAAVFVEEGAPFNKIVGLGFDGVPAAATLDHVEAQFAERRAPLQAEVSSLGDPEVLKTLARRGYELIGFENVLGLSITADAIARLRQPTPDVTIATAGASETSAWMETVIEGFQHPDTFDGPPSHEALIPRDVLERVFGDTIAATGFQRFIARRGGEIAGGASFRIENGVAQLSGAATVPAHRRHGVQSALLRHRLIEAARAGCDIAVVTTQPGSKSQENVQKAGFELLYARAIMVREVSAPASRLPASGQ
jgi:GNAT superfamily N-acetyltransferase